MKPQQIHLDDWHRILIGDVPAAFYLELIIRAAFIYALLMVCMRLLGKRMSSRLSRLELAAITALAAAIGVPMMSPDRGLVPALVIAGIVVGMTRVIQALTVRNRRFEKIIEGDVDRLVENSTLRFTAMARVKISRERVFAHLRRQHIVHLGAVKRFYMESNGDFALILYEASRPGLSLLPDWDEEFWARKVKPTDVLLCRNCGIEKEGHTHTVGNGIQCTNCGAAHWTHAVIER